jgi:hypothetical protein
MSHDFGRALGHVYFAKKGGMHMSKLMTTMRCKFRCNEIGIRDYTGSVMGDDGKYKKVSRMLYSAKLTPVFSDKPNSENKKFWDATPSGSFEVSSINPDYFEPGREYYLDITPAPDTQE